MISHFSYEGFTWDALQKDHLLSCVGKFGEGKGAETIMRPQVHLTLEKEEKVHICG